jgi:hypothetical protein
MSIIEKRKYFVEEEMCYGKRRFIESCSKSNGVQNTCDKFPFFSDSSNQEQMDEEASG